jgi:hypothetical protein
MRPARRVFVLFCALLCTLPAMAEEKAAETLVSTAVVGLRGGFDSSPTNSKGEKGSPTLTGFASWNYLRGTLQDGYGLDLLLVDTQYDPRELAASRLHTLTLKHATAIGGNLSLQSSLAIENEQTWSRRRSSLTWRERLNLSSALFGCSPMPRHGWPR